MLDELIAQEEAQLYTQPVTETIEVEAPESGSIFIYNSTRKLRKQLRKTYLNELIHCRVCRKANRKLKYNTLGEAHRQLFLAPSSTPLLQEITLRDLTKKKKVPDPVLEEVLEYYKEKKEELENNMNKEKQTSAGETYYFIHTEWLP